MAIEYLRQSNWTNGELDPQMIGRRDLKAYHASLAIAENHLTSPQGPLGRRPGLRHVSKLRRELEEIDQGGMTFDAPNGGSGGAGMVTTVELSNTDPYVVLAIDMGAPTLVHCVDVINVGVMAGGVYPGEAPFSYPWGTETVLEALKVQYLVGAVWTDFGPAFGLGTFLRTRRAGLPTGEGVTAQEWRIVKVGNHDWGAFFFFLGNFAFWSETEDLSEVKLRRFTFDTESQKYMLVATSLNIEVFHDGARVASIRVPYASAYLAQVRAVQRLDTLLLFHKDFAPLRITRQGAHGEWDVRPAVFLNVPVFDYTGEATGGVNDQQQLTFRDYLLNDTFNITFEGETTTSIIYHTTAATTVTRIRNALEALNNVGVGGVIVASVSATVYTVQFVGDNASQDCGEMAPQTLSSAAGGVTCATLVQGKEGGEAIMSDTRGWPACGALYQGRLWLGGLRSRPGTLMGSRTTNYFDLNTRGASSSSAISIDLDTDEATSILAMFPGRHLQVFTTAAEFYFPTEPIIPVPAVKQATRRGLEVTSPLAEIDGATMFIARGAASISEFLYDDAEQTYKADPLSYLHSHLFEDVTGFGFRRSLSTDRADLAVFARRDGAAVAMTAMRSQGVTGCVPWSTAGEFLDFEADVGGDIYAVVRRAYGEDLDDADLFLEVFDYDHLLDASFRHEVAEEDDPVLAFADLDWLEGRTVVLYIDGADAGDAVVSEGAVALPFAPLRQVEIGINYQPRGRTLPFVLENDPRGGLAVGARVGEINFRLGPTANLKAGIADGRMYTVPLRRRAPSDLQDSGPGENAFEGWTRLYGVPGFRNDAQVEWVQERPGPLCIQEIVATVQT